MVAMWATVLTLSLAPRVVSFDAAGIGPTVATGVGPTFGTGYTPDEGSYCKGGSGQKDTVIFNHNVTQGSTHAVLTHFWVTGPQFIVDRIWVSYYIDGESKPSIAFQPSMMCGVGFPTLRAPADLFNVGGLCGKSAAIGGFHNSFPIPFSRSVIVTVRPDDQDGRCNWGYFNIRGTENLPLVFPQSGISLPINARLQLHRNDFASRQPREFVNITALEPGFHGMLMMTSWAVEARPLGGVKAGGGYIEGCWNAYTTHDTPYPGIVVGTGVEDYFDSSYYFGFDSKLHKGVTFTSAQAGLTIFDHSTDGTTEHLSAYRLHTTDPLVFTNGGRFTWQVGGNNLPGRTKCGIRKTLTRTGMLPGEPQDKIPQRVLSAVNVSTYGWIYVWPSSHSTDIVQI